MSSTSIPVEYAQNLETLEEAILSVHQSGAYYASGDLEVAMPRMTVSGIGPLSFPVPPSQAEALVKAAQPAPFGRGEETIYDLSVRKVWQISPAEVHVTGKSWSNALDSIVGAAAAGLGCEMADVAAELYKLLIYDEGGFFLSHRDTEKSSGMFGTLVVCLPSVHEGGDLLVHHGSQSVCITLATDEPSELRWAAFYADCEHEVEMVTSGYRVCLVYNLIKSSGASPDGTSPDIDLPAAEIAKQLGQCFASENAPTKLAWLLEHHYSPAELSFATLKGADHGRAVVLRSACSQRGMALHLGMVHIEECGAAEVDYEPDHYRRSRHYRRYEEDEDETDEDNPSFEVVDVADSWQHIDTWRAPDGSEPDFGSLSLETGELIPSGALDGEEPDHAKLTEATGNEGASFERAYHRAVLVVWPHNKMAEVLMQAGADAALPWLVAQVDATQNAESVDADTKNRLLEVAKRMTSDWPMYSNWRRPATAQELAARRSSMLQTLCKMGNLDLVSDFFGSVIAVTFEGTEQQAVISALMSLRGERAAPLLARLLGIRWKEVPTACTKLLAALAKEAPSLLKEHRNVVADALAQVLPATPKLHDPYAFTVRKPYGYNSPARPDSCAFGPPELKLLLTACDTLQLLTAVLKAIIQHDIPFDPLLLLTPALESLAAQAESSLQQFSGLWEHTCTLLMNRSAQPPPSPTNWYVPMNLSCNCADCKALQTFCHDPVETTARFRMATNRRQHLHEKIDAHLLDMTHETERKGSPYTLVCTKTRRKEKLRLKQYQDDLQAFRTLEQVAATFGQADSALVQQLRRARL